MLPTPSTRRISRASRTVICSFCPTAINAVLTSRLYHLTTDLAVASFVITTGLFLPILFPALFFLLR